MLCKKCGTNIPDGIKFCPNCGAQNDILEAGVQGVVNNQQSTFEQPFNNPTTVDSYQQPVQTAQQFQQPVNNYQQPMYNQQPTPQGSSNYTYNNGGSDFNSGSNKASSGLIIGVLIAVIAAVGVIYYSFNDKGKDKNSNSNSNSNVVSNSNVTSTSNSNVASQITSNKPSNVTSQVTSNKPSNVTSQVTSNKVSNVASNKTSQVTSNKTTTTNTNYNSVKHNGYILQIPKKYAVEENVTNRLMLDETGTNNYVALSILSGSYSTMRNNLSTINQYINNSGVVSATNAYVKTINGVEYIIMQASIDGYSQTMAYAKISSTKVFLIVVPKVSYLTEFAYTVKTIKAA